MKLHPDLWTEQPDGANIAKVTDIHGTTWTLAAYWDSTDTHNQGWAYRAAGPEMGQEESGPADSLQDAMIQAADRVECHCHGCDPDSSACGKCGSDPCSCGCPNGDSDREHYYCCAQ